MCLKYFDAHNNYNNTTIVTMDCRNEVLMINYNLTVKYSRKYGIIIIFIIIVLCMHRMYSIQKNVQKELLIVKHTVLYIVHCTVCTILYVQYCMFHY